MGRLNGQVAVITGGAGGIGRAVLERFLAEGACCGVLDNNAERLAEVRQSWPEVVTVQGDVRAWEAHRQLKDAVLGRFGKIDVFVGNAGIFDGNRALLAIGEDQLDAAFDEVFHINVKGYLIGARVYAPELVRSRGSIILTASYASEFPGKGGVLYTASKHAVLGVVRQLAWELAPEVRVNAVAPGVAATTMRGVEALGQGMLPAVLPDTRPDGLLVGDIPQPSDFAGLYLLLADPSDNRALTGTLLVADSGMRYRK